MISWSLSLSLASLNHHNNNVIHMFLRLPPPQYWMALGISSSPGDCRRSERDDLVFALLLFIYTRTFVVRRSTDRQSISPLCSNLLWRWMCPPATAAASALLNWQSKWWMVAVAAAGKKKLEPWEIFAKMRKHQREPLHSSSRGTSYLTVLLLYSTATRDGLFSFSVVLDLCREPQQASQPPPTKTNDILVPLRILEMLLN